MSEVPRRKLLGWLASLPFAGLLGFGEVAKLPLPHFPYAGLSDHQAWWLQPPTTATLEVRVFDADSVEFRVTGSEGYSVNSGRGTR